MGLRTLVRADLARRGLKWTRSAPVGNPNKKASRRLQARIVDYERTINQPRVNASAFTRPGSQKPHQ